IRLLNESRHLRLSPRRFSQENHSIGRLFTQPGSKADTADFSSMMRPVDPNHLNAGPLVRVVSAAADEHDRAQSSTASDFHCPLPRSILTTMGACPNGHRFRPMIAYRLGAGRAWPIMNGARPAPVAKRHSRRPLRPSRLCCLYLGATRVLRLSAP